LYGCKGYFKRSLYLFERAGLLAAGYLLFAPGWTTTLIVLVLAPPWIYLNWYRMKSHGLDKNAGGFAMPPGLRQSEKDATSFLAHQTKEKPHEN